MTIPADSMTAKTGFLMERSLRVMTGVRGQGSGVRGQEWPRFALGGSEAPVFRDFLRLLRRDRQGRVVLQRLRALADDPVPLAKALQHLDIAPTALAELQG